MVHSAYDSFELLKDCPTKIESIEVYGPKLLLGCSDGSLKVYASESSASGHSPTSDYHAQTLELRKEPYVLVRNMVGFTKKPLVSMEVLESRELLLCLSESIAFHRLPNLETIAVLTKAKGANAYCWDCRRGFLCFARQKRVCIFRHDGGRGFVEVKEFGVPDMVKSMSWCGENICLGIRREYVILGYLGLSHCHLANSFLGRTTLEFLWTKTGSLFKKAGFVGLRLLQLLSSRSHMQ